MKKNLIVAFVTLLFASLTHSEAQNLLSKGNDLKWAIIALSAQSNLPIFLQENVQKKSYGRVEITKRTVDYEVGVETPEDLKAIRDAVAGYQHSTDFYKKTHPKVIDAEQIGDYFYHTIEWDGGGKATIVLIRKPFGYAYFEDLHKNIYTKHPYLWAIRTSSLWARNFWDRSYWTNDPSLPPEPLLGKGMKVGFWDEGLAKDHKFGDHYKGGYDYIYDLPLGSGLKEKQSPIWNNTKKHLHGHGLSHIVGGPDGLLPEADIYFDVMFAAYHKINIDGVTHNIEAYADTEILPYMMRVGDPFGPARAMIDRGVRVINLSYGTVTASQQPLGPGLRNYLRGKVVQPSSELLGYLTDNNIALTINAGNNKDKKGPQHPASLASDDVGFSGRILAVGAYTPEGTLGQSNWATENESMQKHYILAPSYGVTSNAAPVAAGALGLLMTLYPDLKAEDAVRILIETATPLDPVKQYGSGHIDLEKASQAVINMMRKDPNLSAKLGVDISVRVYPKAISQDSAVALQAIVPVKEVQKAKGKPQPLVKEIKKSKDKAMQKGKKGKVKAKAKAKPKKVINKKK